MITSENAPDASLNLLVTDAARKALQIQKTALDMAKSVRTASLEAVQSPAFREAMADWISRYLAEKLASLKIFVESRGRDYRDACDIRDIRDAIILFPSALSSHIREISIVVLGTLAKRPEPLRSVDFDRVLNPHLDAIQRDRGIIDEFTAQVLRRAGEIIADESGTGSDL